MTREELHVKLASVILDAIMFKKPEEKPLHEEIDDLLFNESAGDTIRVTIHIDGIDRQAMRKSDCNSIGPAAEDETFAVLCVRLVVDGKDNSERCGGLPVLEANDFILSTPTKATPPKAAS